MASDDKIIVLLKQRSVRCTLRKQPKELTDWFYQALKIYSFLWVRSDKDKPPVKGYINELFTLLKFVALPNNNDRKRAKIDEKWPSLKEKIDAL